MEESGLLGFFPWPAHIVVFILYVYFMCVRILSECFSLHHAHAWCLWGPEGSNGVPGTEVIDVWPTVWVLRPGHGPFEALSALHLHAVCLLPHTTQDRPCPGLAETAPWIDPQAFLMEQFLRWNCLFLAALVCFRLTETSAALDDQAGAQCARPDSTRFVWLSFKCIKSVPHES